jgi:hypothetical protein
VIVLYLLKTLMLTETRGGLPGRRTALRAVYADGEPSVSSTTSTMMVRQPDGDGFVTLPVTRCPNDPGGSGLWIGYHCRQDATLRQRYGITCEQYWTLFELQGGKCAVCKRRPTKRYRLVVDHDHDDGLVRGLVHGRCNRWITRAVVRYIKKPPGEVLQIHVAPEKMAKLEQLARERVQRERAKQNEAAQRKKGYVVPKKEPQRPSSLRDKLRPGA